MKLTYTFGFITLTIFTASIFGAEDPAKKLVPADKDQINQRDADAHLSLDDAAAQYALRMSTQLEQAFERQQKRFDALLASIDSTEAAFDLFFKGEEFKELEEEGRKKRAEWDKKFEKTNREFNAISAGLQERMEREKQEAMRKADERACKAAQEWSALLILILESQNNNASAM